MYKTNRVNHDFQIVHFLAGSCHTPDAAWSLLKDQHEDREAAIRHAENNRMRIEAKKMKLRFQIEETGYEWEKMELEADLNDVIRAAELDEKNLAAAYDELATIEKCLATLEPMRKFRHLSDREAHEAAQHDEWKLHLAYETQNFLLTQGTVPPDHFSAMRKHPEFRSFLLPAMEDAHWQITRAKAELTSPGAEKKTLADLPMLVAPPAYELPKLLGHNPTKD